MKQPAKVKKAPPVEAERTRRTPFISVIVLLGAVSYALWATRRLDVLRYVSTGQFDWGSSTTTVPISTVSVLLKRLLSRDETLPADLLAEVPPSDTIHVQSVRNWLNRRRLERLSAVCSAGRACNVRSVGRHGTTALHVAAFSHDTALADFLRERGAPDLFDDAKRLPRNLSFANFIENSRRWAKLPDCELPVIDYDGSDEARAETHRLVSEGEPVLLRGALRSVAPDLIDKFSIEQLIEKFGDVQVRVGAVPYASYFNLTTSSMSLAKFYADHMASPETNDAPLYVFAKHAGVAAEGYAALEKLVMDAFPISTLITSPSKTGGAAETHFFLGRARSGAPFHLHADAVNGAVYGRKHWYIYTPARSLYSRASVADWVRDSLPELDESSRPLECVQHPGDVIYVPLDWGHAVLNKDDVFGLALELLNRRATLLDVAGRGKAVM